MTFDLLFLGTAASTPSADRGLPALLVSFGPHRMLVDCGEGTQRQLLKSGAGFRNLSRILLTHGHLDHVLGLGGLIATLGLLDIGAPLAIHGGPETLAYLRRYLVEGVWAGGAPPIPVMFAALESGVVAEDDRFRVSCFRVEHRDAESFGFLFEAKPRRHLIRERLAELRIPEGPARRQLARQRAVLLPDGRRIDPEDVLGPPGNGVRLAVVGDAGDTASLAHAVHGADALVIEATFLEVDGDKAADRGHLTAAQAAHLAADAGVGALHLTHISGRYDVAEIQAEARRIFPRVRVAADFDRATVAARR